MEKSSACRMPYIRMGKGEALVLIHGLGEIKEGWFKQFELADQYELIIPDLRGHGDNHNLEDISIKNFASDIICLLNELNIESAHICGLSMGGTVAQEIYRRAPERCLSLSLVNTFHYAPRQLINLFFNIRRARTELLTPDYQKMLAARTCLYSWRKEIVDDFYKYYQPNKSGYLKSMDACLEVDNRSLLPEIKVPTLIIGSQYDSITPVWVQILMHELIPHSELVIFKEAGHISKLEASKDFNRVLRRFLSKYRECSEAI